jgi:hypothetical protein
MSQLCIANETHVWIENEVEEGKKPCQIKLKNFPYGKFSRVHLLINGLICFCSSDDSFDEQFLETALVTAYFFRF